MELKTNMKYSLAGLAGNTLNCSCGDHIIETKQILFERNAIAKIGNIVVEHFSRHVKVLIVSANEINSAIAKDIVLVLKESEIRCQEYVFEFAAKQSVEDSDKILQSIAEDIMLIVGVGSGTVCELVKYVATKCRKPYMLVPTLISSDCYLSQFCSLTFQGLPEIYVVVPPIAVICDTMLLANSPPQAVASCLGLILTKSINLLEWYFAHILKGEKYCYTIAELCEGLIRDTLEYCHAVLKNEKNAIVKIFENLLQISLFTQCTLSSRLVYSSPQQAADYITLIKPNVRNKGENAYIASIILAKTYIKYFEKINFDSYPPPDNVGRLERLSENLNISELVLAKKISPLLSGEEYELFNYKVKRYSIDLALLCKQCDMQISKSYKYFSRLYYDCGKWITTYLSEEEIRETLAFASDISDKYTLLSFLKDVGYLEQFL